jgi:hypothetical protein
LRWSSMIFPLPASSNSRCTKAPSIGTCEQFKLNPRHTPLSQGTRFESPQFMTDQKVLPITRPGEGPKTRVPSLLQNRPLQNCAVSHSVDPPVSLNQSIPTR